MLETRPSKITLDVTLMIFFLFNIISIITYIYLYTLAMIAYIKESNLPNFFPNPLIDRLHKLHYKQRCIKYVK